MKHILLLIVVFAFTACGAKNTDLKKTENKTDLPKEQVKQKAGDLKPYQALLEFKDAPGWIFPKDYKSYTADESDIEAAEKLLQYAFDDQKRPTVNRVAGKTLDEYNRQFVFALNDKGEKIAWINCFCKSQESDFKNWNTNVVMVKDGGNCFFNAKVNLTLNTYTEFNVNGQG